MEVPWVPRCSQDGFGQVLGGSWGSLGIILGQLFEYFSLTNLFWDVVLGVRRRFFLLEASGSENDYD